MLQSISFESQVRLGVFLVILVTLVMLELLWPRRGDIIRRRRWPANFGVFALNVVMLAILPVTAVSAALVSLEYKFGLFFWVEVPFWPKVIFSVIVLDLVIYWQHRIFHMWDMGWRFHRMHHADTGFDATTALRFHPVEIFISVLIKAVAIILLGAPVFAVVLFEVILNGSAMFNHSNFRLPLWLDRLIRPVIVTPDMHRVHHSTISSEHNMNYGFALSVWDRIFGSYLPQPSAGHEEMEIGLKRFREPAEMRVDKLITQPFRN